MAKNDKKDALVSQPELPAHLAQIQGAEGTDTIGAEDSSVPRLKIAQPGSPQLDEAKPEYIEGLKAGEAFNDLTLVNYGKGPFHVVVVRADKPRFVEFDPDDRTKVIDRDVPANDKRTQWDQDGPGSKPRATKFLDFVFMFMPVDSEGVAVLDLAEALACSFSSTGLKAAQTIRGVARQPMRGRQWPLYAKLYELRTSRRENNQGVWYVWSVTFKGLVEDPALFELAKAGFDSMVEKQVDFATEAEAAGEDTGDPDAPGDSVENRM